MPDETADAPEDLGQASEPEAPETGQATEAQESFTDFDPAKDIPEDADKAWFENQYNELRKGFTQKTQGIAQERQEAQEYRDFITAIQNDPAARDAWLQQEFGYEFEDGDEQEFLDPEEELRAEVEALKGHLAQREEAEFTSQQEDEVSEFIEDKIDELETAQGKGFKFSEDEVSYLTMMANRHPLPNGAPNVQGANELLERMMDQRQKQWIESKKSGRRISQGSPAKKAFDPTNQEERMKFYDDFAEEAAPSLE